MSSACNQSGRRGLFDLSYFKVASILLLGGGGLRSSGKMFEFLRTAGLGLIGGLTFHENVVYTSLLFMLRR